MDAKGIAAAIQARTQREVTVAAKVLSPAEMYLLGAVHAGRIMGVVTILGLQAEATDQPTPGGG